VEEEARAQRENFDMSVRLMQEKSRQDMLQFASAVSAVFDLLNAATSTAASDPLHTLYCACFGTLVFTLATALGVAIQLSGVYIRNRCLEPSILRETSRDRGCSAVLHRLVGIWRSSRRAAANLNSGLVLKDETHKQAEQLIASLATARAMRTPLRHILIHGPPGVGKVSVLLYDGS
jgi:ATPase family AAA domain-containing protein 3A/B